MFRQAIERCPDDIWLAGEHPRNYRRIAYHAAHYVHLYMCVDMESFQPWSKASENCRVLWETPPIEPAFTQAEMMEYTDEIIANTERLISLIDLDAQETGFDWYPNMAKLDHLLLSLRHFQGHIGQMSELLMARGIEIDWIR